VSVLHASSCRSLRAVCLAQRFTNLHTHVYTPTLSFFTPCSFKDPSSNNIECKALTKQDNLFAKYYVK